MKLVEIYRSLLEQARGDYWPKRFGLDLEDYKEAYEEVLLVQRKSGFPYLKSSTESPHENFIFMGTEIYLESKEQDE